MGACKYWGGFFYPPNPSQQNHFMHPQPHPKRRKEKEPNKLPHPSFETTPQPPFTKNGHAHAACSTTHSHSHSLFFPAFTFLTFFLNYLTFDINITTKAMCSRHAYLLMRQGLSEDRVELLPDSSTFNFANGQKALAREKCRIWFSYEPPLFTDFSIVDEGKVPFLMSLPQMKNLGVSLDLRGTPEKILFHTGFLKGQGVPLHRKSARKPSYRLTREGRFMLPAVSQP